MTALEGLQLTNFLGAAYPWVKAAHVTFVIFWMAGLFLVPRFYVYHHATTPGSAEDRAWIEREDRARTIILNPAMALVWILGLLLAVNIGAFQQKWFLAKFALVIALSAYQGWIARYGKQLAAGKRPMENRSLRIMNEVPGIATALIVVLVIVKPFQLVPTIITHALLPLIATVAVPDLKLSKRLVAAGMIVAVLPDADLVSRFFGIPHTADFGHRGASHTIIFALLVAAAGMLSAPALSASRNRAFWFLFLSCLSHPLADMLTDGGKGLMLFWPLLHDRFVWPVRPVEVSPIGLRAIDEGALDDILLSELLWLILPALLLAALYRWWRRPYIDLTKGQS